MEKEIWRDIPGYEGLYQISDLGRVFSNITGKIRKNVKSDHGYRAIQLSDSNHIKHRHYVHRLVASAFLPIPNDRSTEVNHKNLNKSDNRAANLEWVTPRENSDHAYANGRTNYQRPMRADNTTGYKGISRHSGGFQVNICGKYIGWFKEIDAAAFARWDAERSLYEKDT